MPAVTIFRNEQADRTYRQVDLLAARPSSSERPCCRPSHGPGRRGARIVRREHLIVYKLIAWRDRDRQDISDVVATARAAGETLDLELVWRTGSRLDLPRPLPFP